MEVSSAVGNLLQPFSPPARSMLVANALDESSSLSSPVEGGVLLDS